MITDELHRALEQATPYELYQLQYLIDRILSSPQTVERLKSQLRPGARVGYFNREENRLVPAILLEIGRSLALVEQLEDGQRWRVPLAAIYTDGEVPATQPPPPPKSGLDRARLRVGDRVGFRDRDGRDTVGIVEKLNPRRAKVRTDKALWTVPYELLYPVIEGEIAGGELLGHDDS